MIHTRVESEIRIISTQEQTFFKTEKMAFTYPLKGFYSVYNGTGHTLNYKFGINGENPKTIKAKMLCVKFQLYQK